MMFIKLTVGRHVVNVVSAYAPQVGLDEEVKKDILGRYGWGCARQYRRRKKSLLGVTLMGISRQPLAGLKMSMEALVLDRGMDVGRLSLILLKSLS